METELEKQAHYLKIYVAIILLFCGAFLLADFSLHNQRISIDCVNISGNNGKITMILTIPSSRVAEGRQKIIETEEVRYPGMFFYN